MKESELAEHFVKYFESLGYEVFKEVGFGGSSIRADIYCKQNSETIAIEVKKSLNLKVIDQAYKWRPYATKSYIAVPKKRDKSTRLIVDICESLGIGLLEVLIGFNTVEITEKIKPAIHTNPSLPNLYEEQKNSIAGNSNSQFITPFKITCIRLIEFVKTKEKIFLHEAIENIEHHYSNNKSASAAIKKMIENGVISELIIFKEGNKNFIKLK